MEHGEGQQAGEPSVAEGSAAKRRRLCIGLLLVGGLLRSWWLAVFINDPSTSFPHGNTGGFVRVAREFLENGLLAGDRALFYGPLYSVYLSVCFTVTGSEGLILPRVLQSFMGLALAVLVWRITRRAFGDEAALGAGALMLFYGPALFFEGLAVATTLSTTLLLLGVDLLTGSLDAEGTVKRSRRELWRLAAAGAAFGLCAWGRGNVLLLLPPAALWILWRTPLDSPSLLSARVRRLLPTAAFTLGACALILPVTARNVTIGGDAVLLVSQGGLNYFVGNNPDSPGFFSPPEAAGLVDDSDQAWEENSRRVAEVALGQALTTSEASSYWFDRAFRWMASDPRAALSLHWTKFLLLLDPYEIPIHRNAQVYLAEFPIGFALPGWGVLVALSLAGLGLSGCGRDQRGLLLLLATVYGLTVIAFFVTDRYRFPLAPLLAPFAGLALATFFRALRERRQFSRRIAAAAVLAGIAWTVLHWDGGPLRASSLTPELRQRYVALEYHRRAASWERLGEPERALTFYNQALEAAPGHVPSRLRQCKLLLDAGRTEEALGILRVLVDIAPDSKQARRLLKRAEKLHR